MNYNKILLESIHNKTGIYLSNKNDCKLLSMWIVNEKLGYLSESTLYRFFLHSNNHKPYKNTLNIIAQFCGYTSWNHFINYCDTNFLYTDTGFLNNAFDCVIKDLILKEKFHSLIDVFESIENENYKTKEFVGLRTFVNFQNTKSFPLFVEKFGQNEFVRKIILESLYDPFHRIIGYTDSFNYYLNFNNIQCQNYLQDFVFGNAILFRYYYINNDIKAKEFGEKLYDFPLSENEFEKIHLFPKVRYVAYKIWYLEMNNVRKNKFLEYLEFAYYWICKEFDKTNSIIELNIIMQTFLEVFQNRQSSHFLQKINVLHQNKIKMMRNSNVEIIKAQQDANGLLNILHL